MPDSRKAVFLDRDGTLIEDVGFLSTPDGICLYSDTIDALRRLQKEYLLFVVTNQSGIARGQLSIAQVDAINRKLDGNLSEQGIQIQEWYVCPHEKKDFCQCMKPYPSFLLKAAEEYRLDLRESFIIGDHPHDALTGRDLGVFGLFLLTGHGGKHLAELPPGIPVFHRLTDAVDWIIRNPVPGNLVAPPQSA
ncbi:MAG: HAD-IIIA family hydrolase [Acidobacteriota bacterium]